MIPSNYAVLTFLRYMLRLWWQLNKQAGTELGQAQLKLELYYTLIFCRFGLIELTGWYINYLDCINLRNQLCFLHNQNLSWIGRDMNKIEI